MDNALRMYVLVNREVLPLVHAGVQASHACAEYIWKHRDDDKTKKWCEEDKTLLFLNGDKNDMNDLICYCDKTGIKYSKFIEPDMNDEMTAVAFQPMTKTEGAVLFGKFKLLV
jgi:hypothetical protein